MKTKSKLLINCLIIVLLIMGIGYTNDYFVSVNQLKYRLSKNIHFDSFHYIGSNRTKILGYSDNLIFEYETTGLFGINRLESKFITPADTNVFFIRGEGLWFESDEPLNFLKLEYNNKDMTIESTQVPMSRVYKGDHTYYHTNSEYSDYGYLENDEGTKFVQIYNRLISEKEILPSEVELSIIDKNGSPIDFHHSNAILYSFSMMRNDMFLTSVAGIETYPFVNGDFELLFSKKVDYDQDVYYKYYRKEDTIYKVRDEINAQNYHYWLDVEPIEILNPALAGVIIDVVIPHLP